MSYAVEYLGLDPRASRASSLAAALGWAEMVQGDSLHWSALLERPSRMTLVGYEFAGAETPRAVIRGPLAAILPDGYRIEVAT